MKYYSIGEFAELIGVTQQTLRNWDKVGKLKPSHKGKKMIKELLEDDNSPESQT